MVSMQGVGTGSYFSAPTAAGKRNVLHAPATSRTGTRRAGDSLAEAKPCRAAYIGGAGQKNRLQPFLSQPDFFHANRAYHHAASASAPHGTRGGIAQVG